ncbi:MAG: 1-acyl-sn-glycerol-3-phosphate acyltransferase [Lachnospiraceae bacterium]|nr:1-acyl-sn-glycerol-3-phosphate acyltransferase [Lachnospiraceae bacterium]
MLRTIAAVSFTVLYLILGIPVLGIEYLIGKANPHRRDISSLRMVQWAFRVINRICGVKTTVIGFDNIPTDQAVLYVANHNSYFDIIITYSMCPTLTGYISKDDIEKVPLLNIWMKRLYCLFMNRDDVKQSLKVILKGAEQVKNGISMCVFPEGTRGTSEEMLPFKNGSMKIAEKTGCPVIPIAISNTRKIIGDHFPRVIPTHVIVEYGAPIYPNELSKEERKSLGKITQNAIQKMLDRAAAELPVL